MRAFRLLSLALSVVFLVGCDKDSSEYVLSDDMNITFRFNRQFAALLKEKGYIPNAFNIRYSDVKDITAVDVSGKSWPSGSLTSLAGIEYFTAMTHLDCSANELDNLDVSKNKMLTELHCDYNFLLSTLKLGENTRLTYLDCNLNNLASLDIGKCTALTTLHCKFNQFSSLDVSANTMLALLDCENNKLATLDLTKNTALTSLRCGFNNLTGIDISKCVALDFLWCEDNQLTSLDVSNNEALTKLNCNGNQLTSLDVSKNTALTSLWCFANRLSSLDISKNIALTSFSCGDNPGDDARFVVDAWFAHHTVQNDFTIGNWWYNDKIISFSYKKVN